MVEVKSPAFNPACLGSRITLRRLSCLTFGLTEEETNRYMEHFELAPTYDEELTHLQETIKLKIRSNEKLSS